jgi:hypothetical protein
MKESSPLYSSPKTLIPTLTSPLTSSSRAPRYAPLSVLHDVSDRRIQEPDRRKFGQTYYDLGFLSEVNFVKISASGIIDQYSGQTSPKTIK